MRLPGNYFREWFFLVPTGSLENCKQETTKYQVYLIHRTVSHPSFSQLYFHTGCPLGKALERNPWEQWDTNHSSSFKSANPSPWLLQTQLSPILWTVISPGAVFSDGEWSLSNRHTFHQENIVKSYYLVISEMLIDWLYDLLINLCQKSFIPTPTISLYKILICK